MSAFDPSRIFVTRGELQLGGRASGYSSDWMALSSWKRIVLSLLVSEITKRTRPCLEVSAYPARVRTPEKVPVLKRAPSPRRSRLALGSKRCSN